MEGFHGLKEPGVQGRLGGADGDSAVFELKQVA